MTKELQILEQALNLAQSKGAYSLQDSTTILIALTNLKRYFEQEKEPIDNTTAIVEEKFDKTKK